MHAKHGSDDIKDVYAQISAIHIHLLAHTPTALETFCESLNGTSQVLQCNHCVNMNLEP